MITEIQLKKSMSGISDKNLKYAKVISELFESLESTSEEKAVFLSIIGQVSESLNTNKGLLGVEKSKKEMLQVSFIELSKLKGTELRQLCKSFDLDYDAVKQRYLKSIKYV